MMGLKLSLITGETELRIIIDKYISEIKDILEILPWIQIAKASEAIKKAKRIYIFGNGGSASTASHLASGLSKDTNIKAFSLTDNISLLSAWANDTKYDNIFAMQLKNFAEQEDVIIGISCSGKSNNVINGIKLAKDKGITTIGFTGFGGEEFRDMVDIGIVVPSSDIKQIEDIHLLITHIITTCLENK